MIRKTFIIANAVAGLSNFTAATTLDATIVTIRGLNDAFAFIQKTVTGLVTGLFTGVITTETVHCFIWRTGR